MLGYLVRRLAGMVPILIGTTFLIFAAVYALPGDPILALAGPDQVVSESMRAELSARYGLDQPLLMQYWNYLSGLFVGDFGIDLRGVEVSTLISRAWPYTVVLGLTAWAIMAVAGVALGTLAGMRAGGPADWTVLGTTTLLVGVPYFVVAYVSQIVFGLQLGWLPTSGVRAGWPISYLLPATCMAMLAIPELARLTRTSIAENRSADYVSTAVAKGLSRRRVALRHVLRNSLVPVVSVLGLSLGGLLGGSVLTEGIFNIPGLGHLMFTAINQHNGPVIVGVGTLLVLVFLAVNLIIDLLYGLLDPRISLARQN
ncbi:ABC transporter permease [Nonomuraea sp. NPDC050404]|uniref:ABC transporter permease n=1 Tax=Nonomuraea sp. NPDC050404 TaxID=3155783 RepID=UPI0033FAF1ED